MNAPLDFGVPRNAHVRVGVFLTHTGSPSLLLGYRIANLSGTTRRFSGSRRVDATRCVVNKGGKCDKCHKIRQFHCTLTTLIPGFPILLLQILAQRTDHVGVMLPVEFSRGVTAHAPRRETKIKVPV